MKSFIKAETVLKCTVNLKKGR